MYFHHLSLRYLFTPGSELRLMFSINPATRYSLTHVLFVVGVLQIYNDDDDDDDDGGGGGGGGGGGSPPPDQLPLQTE